MTTNFKRYPSDGDVDVNDLPSLPWTRDALGPLYADMARACGSTVSDSALDPSVDARAWAISRGHKHIADLGLTGEDAEAVLLEASALQEAINEALPDPSGSPRAPGAPPMRGSTTTVKKGRSYF